VEAAQALLGLARSAGIFERIYVQFVLMCMIKPTKKRKKAVVDVKAAWSEPAQPMTIQRVAPTEAQTASVKAQPTPPARVALELTEPAAKQVFVAGSFNGWQPETTPLMPLGNGRWKGDLKLAPGRHEYLFVVDGQWRLDPSARESVDNPFGGKNSVITISE
jgi:hypothetical protein